MPRKSTTSGPATATDANGDVSMVSEAPSMSSPKQSKDQKEKLNRKSGGQQSTDGITIDDLLLPRSIVQRIAKGVLPANTSIQKDAILALTKSATVFISHLADSANEQTDRKTIQSQDVIKALYEIEFDQVMQLGVTGSDGKRGGRLEREVESWEGNVRGKRAGYREKVKARQFTGTNGDTTIGTLDDDAEAAEGEQEHQNKRLRIDDEGNEREGSATGEISKSTQNLKLGASGDRRTQEQDEDDFGEDDVQDDDSDEQDEDEEDEEQEQNEGNIADDSLDLDDADSQRRKGTLAPDGRVEVDNSDDDSD